MDLVAISPVTRTVPLGRGAVEVTGLSLRKLTWLIAEHPELLPLAAGGEVRLARLFAEAAEAAAAIFLIGVVGPGRTRRGLRFWRQKPAPIEDEAGLLRAFDMAPAGQQLDCLGTIIDLTFKGERVVPFVQMLAAAMARRSSSIPPEPGPSPIPDSGAPDIPPTPPGS